MMIKFSSPWRGYLKRLAFFHRGKILRSRVETDINRQIPRESLMEIVELVIVNSCLVMVEHRRRDFNLDNGWNY